MMRRWLRILVLATFLGPLVPAWADVVIEAETLSVNLGRQVALLEDPTGTLQIADVLVVPAARQYVVQDPRVGYTTAAIWMQVKVRNNTNEARLLWFDTGNHTATEVDFYTADAAGRILRQSASSESPFSERPLRTVEFVFPFEVPARGEVTLHLRLRTKSHLHLSFSPSIWRPSAHEVHAEWLKVQWLVYVGMATALLILNFALWLYLKDASYLHYSLSVFGLATVTASGFAGNGMGFALLWPNWPRFELGLSSMTPALSMGFAYLFLSRLLQFKEVTPRLYALSVAILLGMTALLTIRTVMVLSDLHEVTSALQVMSRVGGVMGILGLFLMFLQMLFALRKKVRLANFAVIAYGTLALVGALNILRTLSSDLSVGRIDWFVVAAMFEMIVMAMALAYRLNQIRLEKDRAQALVITTLERSERDLEQQVQERTMELRDQQQRALGLLHNMLPVEVAEELTRTGRTTPARHEAVTILFTDLSGFTQAAASMPADLMVGELNEVFAAFDAITHETGVEKIKTIGDAYMAAAGLPSACPDHAQRCVRAGLRMVRWINDRNKRSAFKWHVRVGIHSGPVVAGVVGTRKYAFDIWGDTVNIAARMESAGEAGKINVSAYTYHLIRSEFECEYRGKVNAKGKGEVDMYFVVPT